MTAKSKNMSQHMRFGYLLHERAVKALVSLHNGQNHQSLCCSHTQSMGVDKDSDQNSDL